ncbi:phosphatidylinositol 3,4,5-trisphosphate 5-phosphatase 2A-like, partial [Saccoglossus kowalevskii]
VKTDGLKNNKMKLIVDVSGGSLQIMKSTRDVKEDVATYVHTHDKILQLIKSRATNTKLTIKLAASKQKEFIFEDMRKRETFCQLVQQMKNMHSHSSEIDQISVYIGSWNM